MSQYHKDAEVGGRREDPTSKNHALLVVEKARALLSRTQREIFVLHVVVGLTGPEIAEALAMKPAAVRARLHRARTKMNQFLRSTESEGSDVSNVERSSEHAS